jgi:hypothetical protein
VQVREALALLKVEAARLRAELKVKAPQWRRAVADNYPTTLDVRAD